MLHSSKLSNVDKLLNAVSDLVCQVSPDTLNAMAIRLRGMEANKAAGALSSVVRTPTASVIVKQLIEAWSNTAVSVDELASMLLAASHVFTKFSNEQSTELVWTGPTSPLVSARRTEQALLQVINAARSTLFITSFVAYDVSSIVKALNAASDLGVDVSMLLESSQDQGGSINIDVIGQMRGLVPQAKLYAWREKDDEFSGGRVHAKVAVSDGTTCFITSANLTGHAMEKNMEAGVLFSGGKIPKQLDEHLRSLVDMKIIELV